MDAEGQVESEEDAILAQPKGGEASLTALWAEYLHRLSHF